MIEGILPIPTLNHILTLLKVIMILIVITVDVEGYLLIGIIFWMTENFD